MMNSFLIFTRRGLENDHLLPEISTEDAFAARLIFPLNPMYCVEISKKYITIRTIPALDKTGTLAKYPTAIITKMPYNMYK